MQTIFEHIREHLEIRAKLRPPVDNLSRYYESEWSKKFETLMRNRLVMGAMRYGPIHNGMKTDYDRVKGMRKRLDQYADTGNTECLVDVANLALLEFEEGAHPLKHFQQLDGDHSCTS